jgi:Tol biopolymer transport system component
MNVPFSFASVLSLVAFTTAPKTCFGQSCQTDRVNVASTGTQLPDGASEIASTSGDARFVLFSSTSNGIVLGDNNSFSDVFLADRQAGSVRRLSVSPGGGAPDSSSFALGLSKDGRFAVMTSEATNLVPNDTNGRADLFVVEVATGAIERVNVSSQGAQSVGSSNYLASISRNGRRIAFTSDAPDLVPGDTNQTFGGFGLAIDVFVRDLDSGTTVRVSVDSNGSQANDSSIGPLSMSGDGRYVAFSSNASNLVPGDTNVSLDVFLHDMITGATERASVGTGGVELIQSVCGLPSVSDDGRFVTFDCEANGSSASLSDGIYLRDRTTGSTSLIAPDRGWQFGSANPTSKLSPDGQSIAFADNLLVHLPGNPIGAMQVYSMNRITGALRLVSVDTGGNAPNQGSELCDISDDGSAVLFLSFSPNLIPNDTNSAGDLFVRACDSDWGIPFCAGTTANCPCGNGGTGIGGCENSHATGGAKLRATGLASVTNDALTLLATDTTPMTSVLFFQGTTQVAGGNGLPFGGGLRCVGGSVRRLGARTSSNGSSRYGFLGSDTPISIQGAIPAGGATRNYQATYRDHASTCGAPFNLSNGVTLTWTP